MTTGTEGADPTRHHAAPRAERESRPAPGGPRNERTGRAPDPLVTALREAGCVFAEEEAGVLRDASRGPDDLEALLRARVAGAPLEHLVAQVEFRGLRLSVGPGVFVPRQRTGLLADLAVAAVRAAGDPVFVEAFAGVAPVAAVVRALLPHAEVHATDVDEAALRHARSNLPRPAGVHRGEGLDGLPSRLRGRVAVIAAVPPYVPDGAAGLLPREARDFEPAAALFGGGDGLDHVRALVDRAGDWLVPGGRLLVEMSRGQLGEAAGHARHRGFIPRWHSAAGSNTAVLELAAG